MSLRILIVEDHPGTREALAAALGIGGMTVVGTFERGEDALAAVDALRPDVALVDLELPGMSGLATLRALREALPELPVLVLTVFETPELILSVIRAGAGGYLLKGTPLSELHAAVRRVHAGQVPLSPEVARHVAAAIRSAPPDETSAIATLSQRERDVLVLLARGHTYTSIAAALDIQLGTVQTHVKSIYKKLEVSSKAEAAMIASRGRLLDD